MKKQLIIFCLLISLCPAFVYAGAGSLMLGIDFQGDHTASYSGQSYEDDVKLGFCGIVEAFGSQSPNIDLGFGIEIMLPHELDESSSDPTFQFSPAYCSVLLHSTRSRMYPYLNIMLGYNLNFTGNDDYSGSNDLKGGLYYGIGIGLIANRSTRVELRIANYEGTIDASNDIDVEYRKTGLMIGKMF